MLSNTWPTCCTAVAGSLLLCGMRDRPAQMMQRAEFHEHIGSENLLPSVELALERARALVA